MEREVPWIMEPHYDHDGANGTMRRSHSSTCWNGVTSRWGGQWRGTDPELNGNSIPDLKTPIRNHKPLNPFGQEAWRRFYRWHGHGLALPCSQPIIEERLGKLEQLSSGAKTAFRSQKELYWASVCILHTGAPRHKTPRP